MSLIGFLILFFVFAVPVFDSYLNILDIRSLNSCKYKDVSELYDEGAFWRVVLYQREKLILGALRKFVNGVVIVAVFVLGFIAYLGRILNGVSNLFIGVAVFFVVVEGVFAVVGLVFDVIDNFIVERKYGFYTGNVAIFIRDILVGGVLGLILLVMVVGVIVFFVDISGAIWWLYASMATVALSVFIAYIYPSVIAPLFNRFVKLEDPSLEAHIGDLFRRAGLRLSGVYVMDASKRSKHTNAYFVGIGSSKRVVLFDTLLNNLNPQEIASVFAHELGHYKLGHIWKMLSVNSSLILVYYYVAHVIINAGWVYKALGLPQTLPCGLFVAFVIVSALYFLLSPVVMVLSRKYEYEADRYAVKITGDRENFIEALKKIYKDNMSNPCPHPLSVVFKYSHPPVLVRLKRLQTDYSQDSVRG